MPTKRRKIAPTRAGITARAIEAWRVGDFHTLNRELGIRPWMVSPFDAHRYGNKMPPHDNPEHWATLPRAMELRRQLIEIAGPAGRVGRHGEPLGLARRARRADEAP